jgi:hypothetical protein
MPRLNKIVQLVPNKESFSNALRFLKVRALVIVPGAVVYCLLQL